MQIQNCNFDKWFLCGRLHIDEGETVEHGLLEGWSAYTLSMILTEQGQKISAPKQHIDSSAFFLRHIFCLSRCDTKIIGGNMKKYWQALVLLFFAGVSMAEQAAALPVVAADSRYNVYVEATASGNVYFVETGFNGVAEIVGIGDRLITVTESETVEGMNSRITITLSSDIDLFAAENDSARLGLGIGGNPLNLLFPVSLLDARIFFLQAEGVVFDSTDNLVALATQNDPWDGSFPNTSEVLDAAGIGGRDVRAISFEFLVGPRVAEVPEPGIMMLGGITLLAFGVARRRKVGAKRL